jgi:glutamyl-tRNA(Gln) amidotransferase subunit E
VRTGIGAGRQDVNVSCKGGTRVEIKGVAHTRWIPELTHIECFRQWALLKIRQELHTRITNQPEWTISHAPVHYHSYKFKYQPMITAKENKHKIVAVNLPGFKGLLSFFTQPGKMFADEITDRLKVIACLERPNMTHSEALESVIPEKDWERIRESLQADEKDAQIVFWAPEADVATALETIEERCKMAFLGVPNETRKSFEDGTTIFERVLPGADRMYPDTDSPPIPLADEHITKLGENLPEEVRDRYGRMLQWGIPEDTFTYIFKNNLYPEIERIINELGIKASVAGTLFGHRLKFVEGHYVRGREFRYHQVFELLKYLTDNNLTIDLAYAMLPHLYQHPKMDMESILTSIKFKKINKEDILAHIPFLKSKYKEIMFHEGDEARNRWIMGQLRRMATGNMAMNELSRIVEQ